MQKLPSLLAAISSVVTAMLGSFVVGDGSEPPNPPPPDSTEPQEHLVRSHALGGGTDREIADRFFITEAELRERFHETLVRARATRRIRIREWQTVLAKGGNASMLTWLGRNELGQSNDPVVAGEPVPEFGEKRG